MITALTSNDTFVVTFQRLAAFVELHAEAAILVAALKDTPSPNARMQQKSPGYDTE